MTHDPLCPARHDAIWEGDPPCTCSEYALVREDERCKAELHDYHMPAWTSGYAAALDAAETAVLDIHEPFVYKNRRGTYCLCCMENSGQEYPTEWPCPTINAIRALREEK